MRKYNVLGFQGLINQAKDKRIISVVCKFEWQKLSLYDYISIIYYKKKCYSVTEQIETTF